MPSLQPDEPYAAKPVAFLQFDHDVRERYGPAAEADAGHPLVVGQYPGVDRALVARPRRGRDGPCRSRSRLVCSRSGTCSPRRTMARTRLALADLDADVVGEIDVRHLTRHLTSTPRVPLSADTRFTAPPQLCTSTEPSPSNSATTLAPGLQRNRGCEPAGQHDAPCREVLTARREDVDQPRDRGRWIAHDRAARARCPTTSPRRAEHAAHQPRSPSSVGARGRAPRTTRAAPALSATESGSRNRSA